MVFDFSEEHREFRTFLRKKLAGLDTLETARARLDDPARSDDTWPVLCEELGLAGLTLPEQYGGSGVGRVEQAVVAEELGRALVGGPYLPTVVLAAEAVVRSGDPDAAERWLPGIAAGTTQAALAVAEGGTSWPGTPTTTASRTADGWVVSGRKSAVVGGAEADLLVVAATTEDGPALLVVTGSTGVTVHRREALDATRPVADVVFDGAPAHRLSGDATEVLAVVREGAATCLAVEQAGGAAACVELTAAYATQRVQFGVPVGRFQGVKHRLADMHVRASQARAAALWAAWQEPGSAEATTAASVARSYCSEAFVQNAFDAVQLHGGIAITWEHDAHLFLRRAQSSASVLGRSSEERARLLAAVEAEASGLDETTGVPA